MSEQVCLSVFAEACNLAYHLHLYGTIYHNQSSPILVGQAVVAAYVAAVSQPMYDTSNMPHKARLQLDAVCGNLSKTCVCVCIMSRGMRGIEGGYINRVVYLYRDTMQCCWHNTTWM